MFGSDRKDGIPGWAGNWPRIAVAAVLGWSTTVYPVLAQTPPSPPPPPGRTLPAPPSNAEAAQAAGQEETYTLEELEYLLGPIALYPDPLLALIFPAAALPDQIEDANAWLDANEEAVGKGDFSGADAAGWDDAVKGLVRFPDVIRMLTGHLDWTESVGAAFKLQPQDVSAAIQSLRAKAEQVGNLKTTEQQTVTTREENGRRTIYVTPANPERIYVPVYDSSTIYTTAATAGLAFLTGYLVGSSWNNRWGWNDRPWNSVWVYRPGWHRPPHWHRPPPHRPPGSWRPDRPNRPGRPDRPDRPGRPDRPDRPGRPDRPDQPGWRPDRPGDRPGARPDRPGVRPERPDRPGNRPDRPGVRPERPDRPGARPDRPSVRPDRPGARPDRPNVRPRPERPAARPSRPQVRPPQQVRPRPQARPSRQQVRPRQEIRRSAPRARPNAGRPHMPHRGR